MSEFRRANGRFITKALHERNIKIHNISPKQDNVSYSAADHSYAAVINEAGQSPILEQADIRNIYTHREEICFDDDEFLLDAVCYTGKPWTDGRVVVELGVFFNALTCKECSLPLEPSKAMEPDMVIGMVKRAKEEGVNVIRIIGDEDSTTIARARREVYETLGKGSDLNHLKKILGNSLYDLKKTHKVLSPKVIKYLQKMYSYAIVQNQGNEKELAANLSAIVPHCFGDHTKFSDKWCGYSKDPENYKHHSLPYGKDLTGDELKKDLTKIFDAKIKDAKNLSYIGSTQPNESLNMTVSSKASKRINYSESRSLTCRVEAAVAQMNNGYGYIAEVSYPNLSMICMPLYIVHEFY